MRKLRGNEIDELSDRIEQMIYDVVESTFDYAVHNELGEDGLYAETDRVRAIIGKQLLIGGLD